jgi:hypothetical protein
VTATDAIDRLVRELTCAPRPLRLVPAVQPYAWGGYEFISLLLGAANPVRTPQAELWIGSHPIAPARVTLDAGDAPLTHLLERGAEVALGPHTARRFGRALPYLLKILDVRAMLSIQAHPDSAQAAEGFAREQWAGVPIDAPHRNYRDASHKPEAIVALSEFWLLHGFRPASEIAAARRAVPEVARLVSDLADGTTAPGRVRGAFSRLMSAPQEVINQALAPLAARVRPLYAARGMRFIDAHAAGPLCHPSRYGLMTGRYPLRTDISRWPTQPLTEDGQVTLPSLLRAASYATAMVGKWQLGFAEHGYDKPLRGGPADRGFDSVFGIRASTDIPPYFYIRGDRSVTPPTGHIDAGASPIQGAFWRAGRSR